MTELVYNGWRIECDVELTRRAYDTIRVGDPETCGCVHCQNFIAARPVVYPPEVREFYASLGVTFDREAEIYEAGPIDQDSHLYCGWHHFIGRILNDPGVEVQLSAGYSVWFSESRMCAEPVFLDYPTVQVEFSTRVPWLLSTPPPE